MPLAGSQEDGARIAVYLESMFQREGAPVLLKRDLGSALRCHQIDEVLERYCVLPLDSPPAYPQYNGSMERSMQDLHAVLERLRLSQLQLPFSVQLELGTIGSITAAYAALATIRRARSNA